MPETTQAVVPGTLSYRTFTRDEVTGLFFGVNSKGDLYKYQTGDGKFCLESCLKYQNKSWKTNMVEAVASAYAGTCTLPEGVRVMKQGLCLLGDEPCTYWVPPEGQFVPFHHALGQRKNFLMDAYREVTELSNWFKILNEYYSFCTGSDQTQYLLSMMVLDLVMANVDRNLKSFGYERLPDGTMKPYPLCGFGLGLFEHDRMFLEKTSLNDALKETRIQPWKANPWELIDFLKKEHSEFLKEFLPHTIWYNVFTFPNPMASEYFAWANAMLGVALTDD